MTKGNKIIKRTFTLLSLFFGLTVTEAVDFNGDGKDDYVLYNRATRQTAFWHLNNNTRISVAAGPTIPAGWNLIAEADFNGDGKPDYFLFNPSTRQTQIWYMNHNIHISTANGPTAIAGWIPTTLADFNGDGKPDVVLYNPATNQTLVWYLNNNTYTGGGYTPTISGGYLLVSAAGDFNHDGKPDFLLYNPATRRSAIWYLNNRTLIGSASGPTIPASYTLEDLADFNHDGRPDYLINVDRVTALWYLNGNILLGSAYGPTIAQGWSLASAASKPCVFSISPHSASYSAEARPGNNIYVSTLQFGCTWTTTVPPAYPWIHITRGNGTNVGSSYATYSVEKNSGAARTGHISIAGQTFTISQAAAVNPSGTWTGTVNTTWNASGCSLNRTVSFSMTISTSGNAVSGNATLNGAPCFNLGDCSVNDFPNSSGTVSGSVTGSTINITYDGVASGGVCDGGGFSLSFDGTLNANGTMITGTTPDVTLTKQ